ncbi:Mismatch repair protein msh3 [Elasticomyces elasticus]|nr:Mismatch repair protein msh3 [Elasticomyces elasticus]
MGSQKPPVPSLGSSQKKQQQSISSFFGAPKPPTKRPLDEPAQPPSKRAREDIEDLTSDGPTAERHNSVHSLDPSAPSRRAPLAAIAGNSRDTSKTTAARTSKYLFSSSPIPNPAAGEDDLGLDDDDQTREVKKRLHLKFVKKLGRPDSIADIKRKNRFITEETEDLEAAEDDEEEAEPEPTSKSKGKKGTATSNKKTKLTPLEKQVLDIKHKHSDTLLVVEVGYKFRFFGEDARIAAKELSIVCIPGKFRFDEHTSEAHIDRFASASVPVHRLNVHVKRLVSAGHKVGVVRQLETAALKAAGTNRNTTFERGLTNLYTKGTYIDDAEPLDGTTENHAQGAAPATGHLLCLTETRPKGWGSDEKVQIGLVAVQPSTGDIIYDDFEDGWMRSELETRLLHIAPCEFLIVGDVSKATEMLVQHLSGSKTNVFGDKARLERVEKEKTMAAEAYSHITTFYATKTRGDGPAGSQVEASQETGTLLDKIHKLSENATICLSAMITHLTEYGLQHVFDLTKYFQSFSARSHMLLNGNTLTSLEIYRNQTDNSERGSLFWTLDRTVTRFGQRMLRKWVGRPLLDKARLDERVAAVEELKDGGGDVDRIKSLLRKTRSDLERSLIRIYYKKCTRPELLGVLQTLQGIAREYAHVSSPADAGFSSALLSEAIASLPKIADDVLQYLERINAEAAKADDKFGFFRDEHETEDITNHKMGIIAVEHDLQGFKAVAAEKLKRKKVDYITVAGIDFLIELDNSQLKNVPASWAKISGTKKMSRYHAPEVVKLIRERDQHKEALSNACDEAFAGLLGAIGEKYQGFRDCVQSLATLDCLCSLAEVATQPGYCKPEFTEAVGVHIEGGRHPMVEQLLMESFVPNDVHLSGGAGGTRALLVTGPNMGGKSSYVRAVALCVIMAQIGSYVPADRARLGLVDAVFTRMGAGDNMMRGESTFMVELGETSDIIKQAGRRSLVILDELGRGTSTHDGVAIAQAVLRHAVEELKCLTLFITHYQSLARIAEQFPAGELKNVHMKFTEQANGQGEPDVTFLYEVGEGVAHRSYGLNVAKLAGLPKSLLDEAGRRSSQMEGVEATRRLAYLAKATSKLLLPGGDVEEMEKLVAAIDQL